MAANTRWDAVIEEESVVYDPWVGGGAEDEKTGDVNPQETRVITKLNEIIDARKKERSTMVKQLINPETGANYTDEEIKNMYHQSPLYDYTVTSVANSEDFKNMFIRILNADDEQYENENITDIRVIDKRWISNRFVAPYSAVQQDYQLNLFKSSAHLKFADSSVGGNYYCNPRPQFTPYADVRADDLLYPLYPDKGSASMKKVTEAKSTQGINFTPGGPGDNVRPGTMGRYYSEAIDDGVQTVYMQFGVPRFNGLLDIFNNAISYEEAYISNKGHPPTLYQATKPIFQAITCITMPITTAIAWIFKSTGSFLLGNKPYNYYYMQPAMDQYWSSVQTLVNHIATDMGILIPLANPKGTNPDVTGTKTYEQASKNTSGKTTKIAQGYTMAIDNSYINQLNAYFGDTYKLFDSNNMIPVYYLMTKYQHRADTIKQQYEISLSKVLQGKSSDTSKSESKSKNPRTGGEAPESLGIEKDASKVTPDGYTDDQKMQDSIKSSFNATKEEIVKFFYSQVDDTYSKLSHWLDNTLRFGDYNLVEDTAARAENGEKFLKPGKSEKETAAEEKKASTMKETGAKEDSSGYLIYKTIDFSQLTSAGQIVDTVMDNVKIWWYNVNKGVSTIADTWSSVTGNALDASLRGAVSYATFAVDHTGATSESFSNQIGELEIGENIKRVGKAIKSVKFNTGGMQTGISAVDKFIDGASQVFNSALDSISWSGTDFIRGLLYGGYFDVPKIWEDSSCSMPTITYTMELISPYGNDISRIQNLVIPLAMVMAGGLPHKIGKSGYASPFLCSSFSKSVQFIRLGMITDISVQRGTTNLAHTLDKEVNGITVSFTVTDLSHKVAVPINSTLYTSWQMVIEEETPYADYLVALAGKNLDEVSFMWKRAKFGYSKLVKDVVGHLRPDKKALWLGNALFDIGIAGPFQNPQSLTANQSM